MNITFTSNKPGVMLGRWVWPTVGYSITIDVSLLDNTTGGDLDQLKQAVVDRFLTADRSLDDLTVTNDPVDDLVGRQIRAVVEPDGDIILVAEGLGPIEVTGVEGTGSVTVVNDLTSGGSTVALSAEQGKVLQNTKYSRPYTGIPRSDMSSDVQASLVKADTSLQSVPVATTTTVGGVKVGSGLIVAGDGTLSATAQTVANATTTAPGLVQLAGDLAGTAAAPTVPGLASKQNTLVSGTNIKTVHGQSLLGSGNLALTAADVGALTEVQADGLYATSRQGDKADSALQPTELGTPGGIATLGSDGKLSFSQVPDLAVTDYLGAVNSQAAMLALTGQKGDWCTRSDLGCVFILSGDDSSQIGSWIQLTYPSSAVLSVAGKTGAVSLVGADILDATGPGLSLLTASTAAAQRQVLSLNNVNNTSDAAKPVSTAQATAIAAAGQTATWGQVTGTITNQTDLVSYVSGQTSGLQQAAADAVAAATAAQAAAEDATAAAAAAQTAADTAVSQVSGVVGTANAAQSTAQDAASQVTAINQAIAALTSTVNQLSAAMVGVNHRPQASLTNGALFDMGPSATGNILTAASDADGDPLTVIAVSYGAQARTVGTTFQTAYGSAVVNADGGYVFTPSSAAWLLRAGQTATEVIGYTISDGQGTSTSSTLTVTITGQNNSPVAIADYGSAPYDTTVSGNILSNDIDPDGGTLAVVSFTVFGQAGTYTAGDTATIAGVGTLQIASDGAWTFAPQTGYSGTVPAVTYTVSNGSLTSTGVLSLSVSPAPTDVVSDPVTTAMTGTNNTYHVYSDSDMNSLPWGALAAGDVVNIYWKATPYRAKFGLRGQGTQGTPIVVNGVTDSNGNRPQFDWSSNAFTAAGCNPSGAFNGATDIFSSTPAFGESLGGLVIKRGAIDGWGTYVPKWIQIKNLDLRGAHGSYTALNSTSQAFVGGSNYGNGLYILMSEDVLIENCVITDNGNGIFIQANNNELAFTSQRLKIRNCRMYGNGIVGSFLEHNVYLQAAGLTVEGCFFGQLRNGALGSTYKSRSAAEIVRYNWIEATARALDFVQSEDSTNGVATYPQYGITWVYGNTIINDETLPWGAASRPIHYGGDNGGEQDSSSTLFVPDTPYRTQLYFWNNTYYQNVSTASNYRVSVFQPSLRGTRVDAWNNIFICRGNAMFSWVEQAGIVNLRGTNIVYGTVSDGSDSANAVNYSINKLGTILTGDPLVVDFLNRDFFLTYSSDAIDLAGAPPSGLTDTTIATTHRIEYQPRKRTNGLVVRNTTGSAFDLGSTEYGVGYTPPPVPAPSVLVTPSISGNAAQGSTLTVNTGSWVGRPSFTYQWNREGSPIAGATSATYITTVSDYHQNVTCSVTGTNASGSFTATTLPLYVISATAPANTVLPVISGTAREGLTVTVSTGTWTNSPSSYSYQWLLDGADIAGATSDSYTLLVGQGGQQISCRVSATNASETGSITTAAATIAFAPADPDANGTFNFSAPNGTLLSALNPNWQGAAGAYSADRFECVNGALQCTAGTGSNGESCYYSTGLGTDQGVEAKILAPWSGDMSFGVQTSNSIAGYVLFLGPTSWSFRRGGIWQNGGSLPNNTSQDLIVKVTKVGGLVKAFVNGTEVFSMTDGSPITGGGAYFSLSPGSTVSNLRMDYLKTQAT